MIKQITLLTIFKNDAALVKLKVLAHHFMEKDIHIVYSPHLDVSGYGKTEEEAKNSFNLCLGEFLDYSIVKKTLHNELISLGWHFSTDKYSFRPSP